MRLPMPRLATFHATPQSHAPVYMFFQAASTPITPTTMRPTKSLRARALDILSRREVSRQQLYRKLAPYAEDPDELEAVLAEFAERNWQSDQRYAEAYIHSKSQKHGTQRLKQALAAQGIDEALIREHLPDARAEQAHANQVLRKKYPAPPADYAEKQKQLRFLVYRGFDLDTANHAVKHAWDDGDADE